MLAVTTYMLVTSRTELEWSTLPHTLDEHDWLAGVMGAEATVDRRWRLRNVSDQAALSSSLARGLQPDD